MQLFLNFLLKSYIKTLISYLSIQYELFQMKIFHVLPSEERCEV